MTKHFAYYLAGFFLIAGLGFANATSAGGETNREPEIPAMQSGKMYLPSKDPVAELEAKLATAKDSGKRLLVIAGGNWCHDSRALAARLFTPPLESVVGSNYETLFVDVGYLDKGEDVLGKLGVPVYYATPTVLIIDPTTGHIVNADDRHQWGDAASIGMDESVDYFENYANVPDAFPEVENPVELQRLLDEINVFELAQAERLYRAYEIVGPMLKAYKEGDKDAFSEQLWNAVRDYRLKVPLDLDALRAEARERVAAGETGISLDYPVYPSFAWELE
jgi:hypothetical protein